MRQYIQIPMDLIKSEWWRKNEVARTLYIDLSQRATYRDDAELPIGCCFFGRLSFAETYGYTDSKVRTALSILTKNGAIKVTPAHTKSIVEVMYISEFLAQKNRQPNDQPNRQPNRQPNDQPNYTENQEDIGGVHQPNHQLNNQPIIQPNRHKHNYNNYITSNYDSNIVSGEKTSPKPSKSIQERIDEFTEDIRRFENLYPREMLNDFWSYWTEKNKNGTKFRAEMEKTWDTGRRLKNWAKRDKNFNNNPKNHQNGTKRNEGLSDAEILQAVAGGIALYNASKRTDNQ